MKSSAEPLVTRDVSPGVESTTKQKRKRKYPFRKAVDIESDIAELEAKITELEAALLTPEVYKDGEKVKRTMAEVEETKDLLADTYEHWEEAVELNG